MIVVEIKAYGKLKRVSKREIDQLYSYIKKKEVKKGILITSSTIVSEVNWNIDVIDGFKIERLLKKYKFSEKLTELEWIQTAKVNKKELNMARSNKRSQIISFILENPKIDKVNTVEKALKLSFKTYLSNRSNKIIKEIRECYELNSDNAQAYMVHP